MGVLPGIMGSIQAMEAVKLVLGVGRPLIGRLLIFDALEMGWREVTLRKNPDCPVCGDVPTQTELIDYEVFCGVAPSPGGGPSTGTPAGAGTAVEGGITAAELRARMDELAKPFLLDVREPRDIARFGKCQGAIHMPLHMLRHRADQTSSAGL